MKRILFKSLSISWLLIVVLVVLGALAISLSRVAMPLANDYRQQISAQVSELVGKPVEIGRIDASWQGARPLVKLSNVTLLNPETRTPILGFEQMSLSVNLWRSLRNLKLTPENLSLKGTSIEITRTRDGRLLIQGIDTTGQESRSFSPASLETLAGASFHLADAQLEFNDRVLDTRYDARIKQMDIQIGDRSVALDAELDLPDSLGERVRLIARTEGALSDLTHWRAHFYLKGEQINLDGVRAFWPKPIPRTSAGELNLELWGQWLPLPGLDISGNVSLLNIQLQGPETAGGVPNSAALNEFSGRFRSTGKLEHWRLDMDQVKVRTPERDWPDIAFSLASSLEDAGSQLEGDLDFADIGSLLELIELSPAIPKKTLEVLQQLQPGGELKGLRFSIQHGNQIPTYHLSANIGQFHWNANGHIPGITGLNGHFSLNPQGGSAELKSDGLQFDAPKLFSSPLDLDSFYTRLEWDKRDPVWDIALDQVRLKNSDTSVIAAGHLQLSEEKGFPKLYLDAILPGAEAKRIPDYIPFKIMKSAKAQTWLSQAFLSGKAQNAQISYEGTLSKAAFKNRTARMKVRFDVKKLNLHYRDGWPELESLNGRVNFDNARLHARIDNGRISGATIDTTRVDIHDLFKANLKVESDAQGDLSHFLDYLKNSPLRKGKEEFLAKIKVSGNTSLNLGLRIPLSRKIKTPLTVRGGLVIEDARLGLPDNNVEFSQANGFLAFTKKTFNAVGIQAQFRGSPVTVSVTTRADEDIAVDISGYFSAARLLPALSAQINSLTQGSARWSARLTLPSKAARLQDQPFSLKVNSDLRGIAIDLPAPLGKSRNSRQKLSVDYRFDSDFPRLDIQYGQLFQLQGVLDAANGMQFASAVVGLSPGDYVIPKRGIHLRGHWAELDTSGWLETIKKLKQYSAPGSTPLDIRDIAITADRWQLGGLTLADARIMARRVAEAWTVRLDSDRLAGNLHLPLSWKGKPAWAWLDYLHLPKGEDNTKAQNAALSPLDLPSIDATVLDLRWGTSLLGEARLQMRRTTTGQHIETFTAESEHLKIRGSGYWRVIGDAQQSTLKLDLSGGDVGAALLNLGFKVGLGSGHGTLNSQLSWQGPPYRPDFASMNGQLKANLREGRLSEIEPGIGRLLGLLSIDYLPRRLELNFKDVSEEGFLYDTLAAKADLFSGDLRLRQLDIDGPAAGISITGRTSLVAHDYGLKITVVPKIKSALPLAAGVLAGPQTGALLFLADKVAESLGVDINRTVSLEYKVTGDWAKPVIESLQEFEDEAQAPDDLDF